MVEKKRRKRNSFERQTENEVLSAGYIGMWVGVCGWSIWVQGEFSFFLVQMAK